MEKRKVKKTQMSEILKYMNTHKGITRAQAMEKFGCLNLPDIIYRLRKRDYDIVSETINTKNRYGQTSTYVKYCLVK